MAAAAAIVSSVAIEESDADGLSSPAARALLVVTGTPQDTSPAALTGNIGPLPNLAAALELQADLGVTKSAAPAPLVAGENVTWTVTVAKAGPDIAADVELPDDVPAGVTLTALPPGCSEDGAGDISCELGTMAALASVELEFEAVVDHDLVFEAGGPFVLTDLGGGLRPDLAGKGLGAVGLPVILAFARERFSRPGFRTAIASFNQRSIVLLSLGRVPTELHVSRPRWARVH